jgi:hypothetical protein
MSQAIPVRDALDRQAFREANRDPMGLPATVLAAGGRDVLAIGANVLRNQGLRLGIYAKMLRDALARNDVQATTAVLTRLGVSAAEQASVGAH